MKTKQIFIFFLILVFGCGCGKRGEDGEVGFDRSAYEEVNFTAISIPEGIGAFALQEDGTMLCSGADEKLYLYGRGGEDREEISSSLYGKLCVDGGNVYAHDYLQSAIVQLAEDGDVFAGSIRAIPGSAAFHTIRNMVALNGKLYVLAIPFTEENAGAFFSFGMQEFEDYGEQVYCIDTASGEFGTLDLEHIAAEYRSEDGRLFFYGWVEEKYYLYEYDTEKEKVSQKLTFDSMGNLLNVVVEGGYLFGISPSDGLVSIDLETGEKLTWAPGVYAMFGNDLQFYRGNLFVNNMAAQEIRQVLAMDMQGNITEIPEASGSVVANGGTDGSGGDGSFGDGKNVADEGNVGGGESPKDSKDSENSTMLTESTPKPTEWSKRNETIAVSADSPLQISEREIKRISGMRTKEIAASLDLEAMIAELMAGNLEVDIYVFTHGLPITQQIKKLGLYVPLNDSEIITEHLGKCFGYIQDAATNDNGDLWMLPLYEYCQSTWYIPENMERFDVTPEDLGTVDGYLAVLERLHGATGAYRYYNQAFTFWNVCDTLYDMNYNDYETGKINFETECYRSLAEFFWTGWDCYGSPDANHPLFFNVRQQLQGESYVAGKTPDFDRNFVIFKTDRVDEHLMRYLFSDSEGSRKFLEGWRVMPFPKIKSDTEKGMVALEYAYVNPYSKQPEAAIEYLEVIAANQSRIAELPVFFREDINYYEEIYDTSLLAFQDLYEIFKNSAVKYGYSWDTSLEYIVDYQRGLIGFDEAIARRQKKAVTGLYE